MSTESTPPDSPLRDLTPEEVATYDRDGTLNASGSATAALNVPANLPIPTGFEFHHAYVVFDSQTGQILTASNPVPVELK